MQMHKTTCGYYSQQQIWIIFEYSNVSGPQQHLWCSMNGALLSSQTIQTNNVHTEPENIGGFFLFLSHEPTVTTIVAPEQKT